MKINDLKTAIIFNVIALVTMATYARQPIEISGYKLSGLSDLVKVTTENVNLRKNPSATSPRLVTPAPSSPDEEFVLLGPAWSNLVKGKSTPCYARANEPYIQLDRNHDYGKYDEIPNGVELWVEFAFNSRYGEYFPVWTKQGFCEIMPNGDLTPDNYYCDNYQKYQLSIRKSGKYKDLCLYQAQVEYEPEDPEGLYVGFLVEGQIVLPLYFPGFDCMRQDEEVQGIEVGDGYIRYNPTFEGHAQTDGGGFMTVDMDKLSDEHISQILAQCKPVCEDEGQMILLRNTFDGGFFKVVVPINGQSFCGLSVEKVSKRFEAQIMSRIIDRPQVQRINNGTTLNRVSMENKATTLHMSFVNSNGLRQWNVNRDAYLTCDVTPGKRYYLVRTKGVNISPRPTNLSGNRNEKIEFSLTFEPVPLNATTITLVEGPSRDNFHIDYINVAQ